MTMTSFDKKFIARLKENYRVGTRVRLIHMDDEHAPPDGTEGTVTDVDDVGTVFVRWDNGSGLGLIYGVDEFRKVG